MMGGGQDGGLDGSGATVNAPGMMMMMQGGGQQYAPSYQTGAAAAPPPPALYNVSDQQQQQQQLHHHQLQQQQQHHHPPPPPQQRPGMMMPQPQPQPPPPPQLYNGGVDHQLAPLQDQMQQMSVNQWGQPIAAPPQPSVGAPGMIPPGPMGGAGGAADGGAGGKLKSAAMPRPCTLEPRCGAPREVFARHGAAPAPPPGANTEHVGVDDGSAIPRFMRMSMSCVATSSALQAKAGVPLGAIVVPFASVEPCEAPPPVIDLRSSATGGPLRCQRCLAYANPGFRFTNGGAKFECNICRMLNDTPSEHMAPIDAVTGARVDAATRPEFRCGSVDYIVASADYCAREPRPAAYVFLIDVSFPSVQSGLALAAVSAVRFILSNAAQLIPGAGSGASVAVVSFDNTIHFYDTRAGDGGGDDDDESAARMLCVPDVDDPFVALGGDGLFSSPKQALKALDCIESVFGLSSGAASGNGGNVDVDHRSASSSCFGAAVKAVRCAMEERGGKVFAVCGSLPTAGAGALERRGGGVGAGAAAGSEEREVALLTSGSEYYENLGCEMAAAQASVDLFVAPGPNVLVDCSTLMRLPRACGGRAMYFGAFEAWKDADMFGRELVRSVRSVRALEAATRVRVSAGLECTEYLGHFARPLKGHELAAPVMSADSCLGVMIAHEGDLPTDESSARAGAQSPFFAQPCVQAAVLYTDPDGLRRIRVHNLFCTKSSSLTDMFKVGDVDAVLSLLAKRAAQAVLCAQVPVSRARDAFVGKSVHALYVYRKFCSSSSSVIQLILPEALKVLPVSVLGLAKSTAFRSLSGSGAGPPVSVDERAAALFRVLWATPDTIAAFAYPRMYSLRDMPPEAGAPLAPNERVYGTREPATSYEPVALPNSIAASSESISQDAVLLVDRGVELVAIAGREVPKDVLRDCFAAVSAPPTASGAPPPSALLVRGVAPSGSAGGGGEESELQQQVEKVVSRILDRRPGMCAVRTLWMSEPGSVDALAYQSLLVEDKGGGFSLGYLEFLKYLHRKIMDQYSSESILKELVMWDKLDQGY